MDQPCSSNVDVTAANSLCIDPEPDQLASSLVDVTVDNLVCIHPAPDAQQTAKPKKQVGHFLLVCNE